MQQTLHSFIQSVLNPEARIEKSSEGRAGLKELKTSTWAAEDKQPTRLFLASYFQASVYLLTGTGTNFQASVTHANDILL